MLPTMDNALIGWGFLETGGTTKYGGEYRAYSMNFDVVAHEIGHAIIYNEVGIPAPEKASGEYYGFHESAADLVKKVSFHSFFAKLLLQSRFYLCSSIAFFHPPKKNRIIKCV